MEPIRHPIASEHLPYFITAPGDFDQMLIVVAVVLAVAVMLLGGFYFWLHSLPERVAHKRRRTQMELVAVLGLVGLFTHNNAFWIAALFLAMIELPVISGPLARIADSLEVLARPPYEPSEAPRGEGAQPHSPGSGTPGSESRAKNDSTQPTEA